MSETYAVESTGDHLFGIAQRDQALLERIMAADATITSLDEAAGRYAMIIAAANNLTDMDLIYLGSELTIPDPEVVLRTSVLASTKDTRDAATLTQVYHEVQPDYLNGGKERIQTALNTEPTPAAVVEADVVGPAQTTLNPARAQELVNAAGSYYMAIASYDAILETLPEADRADAARLLRNTQGLSGLVEERFPNRPDLIEAAGRAESAATRVKAVMDVAATNGSLGTAPTEADTKMLLDATRVRAMQDQVPGTVEGEVTIDKAREAVRGGLLFSPSRLDANAIMDAAPDNSVIEASMAAPSAPTPASPAIEDGFTFRMKMEGRTNFSFTDLAELPLNDANYNAGRDNVNAAGAMTARQELGRLREDVREALIENGVANPSEKQVTQATAYLLAVENGDDRRGDRITSDRTLSIPSSEAAARGVAVFAPAMMEAEGKNLSGGEQRDNAEAVETALFTPNVITGAEVQQR